MTILLAGYVLYPPLVSLLELQLEAGKDLELSSLAPFPGCWGPVLLQLQQFFLSYRIASEF